MDFPKQIIVGNSKIRVNRWTKGDQDRLYLQVVGKRARGCFDLVKGGWNGPRDFSRARQIEIEKQLGLGE